MKIVSQLVALASVTLFACSQKSPEPPTENEQATNGGQSEAAATAKAQGSGTVAQVGADGTSVTLNHEPIAALGWPAMTMSFKVRDPSIVHGIKTGERVNFTVEQQGSDYIITSLQKR
jgi:Cu(I)/Ag(I) efflux system periplasmic protein CusF